MIEAYVAAYPWDLLDDDLPQTLDRLQGEVGATGVSVWMACRRVVELRTRDLRPRVFQTSGGLLFDPDPARYASSESRPAVAEWSAKGDALSRIAQACGERGLKLRTILSVEAVTQSGAATEGPLSHANDAFSCCNAFGVRFSQSICLTAPPVQTLLKAVTTDLSNRDGVHEVTIRDLHGTWSEALDDRLEGGAALTDAARFVLSACFCETCARSAATAGVDTDAARRSVRTIVEDQLVQSGPGRASLEETTAGHEALAAYLRWRGGALLSLLDNLREACRGELLLDRDPLHSPVDRYTLLDPGVPHAVITRVDQSDDVPSAALPNARRSELRWCRPLVSPTAGAALVSTLARAAELGIGGAVIDHFGVLPDPALASVRQAIRFARRTAS